MKWKVEDYLETLKNPNAWFRRAFEQKFVADKILADVILNKDFIRSQKAKNDFTKWKMREWFFTKELADFYKNIGVLFDKKRIKDEFICGRIRKLIVHILYVMFCLSSSGQSYVNLSCTFINHKYSSKKTHKLTNGKL